MHEKLGILGGMGPLATYTLYRNIIENTPVNSDQEHIDMVILNASYIPDRTAGIMQRGESPLPYLLDAVKTLEHCGCDLIAIPCNTSHYYYDELQGGCNVKILHMPDLTAGAAASSGVKKAYLLATEGTIKTGVYQKGFESRDIDMIMPTNEEIAEMMRVIYDIKAGNAPDLSTLRKMAERYEYEHGATAVLGCTEFSTITMGFENLRHIDAMRVLSDTILELFGVKSSI